MMPLLEIFSLLTIFSCTFLIYNKFDYSNKKLLIVFNYFYTYSLYLVYSKAGIFIVIVLILFVVYSKVNLKYNLFYSIISLYSFFFETQSIISNIETLFSKELNYNSGALRDVRYTLAGRG